MTKDPLGIALVATGQMYDHLLELAEVGALEDDRVVDLVGLLDSGGKVAASMALVSIATDLRRLTDDWLRMPEPPASAGPGVPGPDGGPGLPTVCLCGQCQPACGDGLEASAC